MAYKFQSGEAILSGALKQEGVISGSGDVTLAVGKDFNIAGSNVLNLTTLGSSVVGSSLTSVGTLSSLGVGNVTSTGILSASGDLTLGANAGIDIGGQANVLSQATLGSTVLASSLTSVGTLSSLAVGNVTSTGIVSASGDLTLGAGAGIDIGGQANVLSQATLGSTVLASSLTSVGTLSSLAVGNVTSTGILSASGDLTLGAGAGIDIGGAANVLQAATLGSTVLASSLTSVGTLVGVTSSQPIVASAGIRGGAATFDGSISGSGRITLGGTRSIRFANVDALSATTLGSQVLASSLTSVGTLAGVTSSSPIVGPMKPTAFSGSIGVSGSSAKFSGIVNAGRFVGNGAGITGITADTIDVTSSAAAGVTYELAYVEGLGSDVGLGGNTGLSWTPNDDGAYMLMSGTYDGLQSSQLYVGSNPNDALILNVDAGAAEVKSSAYQITISGSNAGGVKLYSGEAPSAGVMIAGTKGLKGLNAAENGTNWRISQAGVISGSGDLTLGAGAGIDIGGQVNVLSQATLGSTVLASSLTSVGTLAGMTSSMGVKVGGYGLWANDLTRSAGDLNIKLHDASANHVGFRLANGGFPLKVLSTGVVAIGASGQLVQASGSIDLNSGLDLKIAGTSVLNATTLGSAVVNSSLTSVGTLTGVTSSQPIVASAGLRTAQNLSASGQLQVAGIASLNGALTVNGSVSMNGASDAILALNSDSLYFRDSDGSMHREAWSDIVSASIANSGLQTSGLSASNGRYALSIQHLQNQSLDVANDRFAFKDAGDDNTFSATFAALATAMAGTGLSAASGQLSLTSGGGSMTAVGDANATLTEGLTYGSTTLTANRTWTLPASSGLSAGDVLRIKAPADVSTFYIKVTGSGGLQSIDAGDAELYIESDAGAIALHYVATDKFVIF
jgi:hypothetical protein